MCQFYHQRKEIIQESQPNNNIKLKVNSGIWKDGGNSFRRSKEIKLGFMELMFLDTKSLGPISNTTRWITLTPTTITYKLITNTITNAPLIVNLITNKSITSKPTSIQDNFTNQILDKKPTNHINFKTNKITKWAIQKS